MSSACSAATPAADEAPAAPGVYVFRGAAGRVLYVGKAANLARRLSDYFQASWDLPEKVRTLRARLQSIEWQVVGSELEALLLENRLIRELAPEINVQREVAGQDAPPPRNQVCRTVPGRQNADGCWGASAAQATGATEATVLLLDSAAAGQAELFFVGPATGLVQWRVCLGRPLPAKRLWALLEWSAGLRNKLPPGRGLAAWDAIGATLAARYLRRFRQELPLLDAADLLAQAPETAATTVATVLAHALSDPEPVAFRLPV